MPSCRRGAGMTAAYYQREGITIYHGDAREILPTLTDIETVICDPVWPDADVAMAGREDPEGLWREVCHVIPPSAVRLVVQLGCDSDPRFLRAVPERWGFLRVCWL